MLLSLFIAKHKNRGGSVEGKIEFPRLEAVSFFFFFSYFHFEQLLNFPVNAYES